MMKDKGFTLVEILAVLVIIGLIVLLAFPSIERAIKKSQDNLYNAQINNIKISARDWASDHMDSLPTIEGDNIDITLGELQKDGYIDKKLNNPKTGKPFSNELPIRISYKDGIYIYNVMADGVIEDAYTDKTLMGNDPKISGGLVPVKIDNDGKVTKADISKSWYNYENREWANAVLLMSDKSYEDGATIPEDDIKGYFVWIPRYRYKLFNVDTFSGSSDLKPQEIEVQFQKLGEVDDGSTVGTWLTHPAFTIFNVSGFWVGKFEITGTIDDITVKPNQKAIVNQQLKVFFEKLYNFDRSGLNSHMIKNTEWGAIAYLSHSKYGKWSNSDYTGENREVYQNKYNGCYTGYSNGTPNISGIATTEQCSWTDTQDRGNGQGACGAGASTTGNITGVYDMVGGASDLSAAYRTVDTGAIGDSGFTKEDIDDYPSKYFDVYINAKDSSKSYEERILGDATGEMGPFSSYHGVWYGDYCYFVKSTAPWFERGGDFDSTENSGIFRASGSSGKSYANSSSRLILMP